MRVTLILADAELEALPVSCDASSEPPRVCRMTDQGLRGIHILDSYLHKALLEGLEDAERRGRPDIVHSFLVLAQNSQANREGKLAVFIHTRGDEVIRVGRKAKIDQNYMAFLSMMSELLSQGHLGSGEERIRIDEHMTLAALLHMLSPGLIIAMSPSGQQVVLKQLLSENEAKQVAIIIGGFPEGDYRSPVYRLADRSVSLGDELLTVPEVTAQVLSSIP